MARKIIGVTVGTPMKPQAVIEKTTQAKQINDNTETISQLSKEIAGLKALIIDGNEVEY